MLGALPDRLRSATRLRARRLRSEAGSSPGPGRRSLESLGTPCGQSGSPRLDLYGFAARELLESNPVWRWRGGPPRTRARRLVVRLRRRAQRPQGWRASAREPWLSVRRGLELLDSHASSRYK